MNHQIYELKKSQLRAFSNEVKQIENVIDLTIGDPEICCSAFIEKLKSAVDKENVHYEKALGNLELRNEIKNFEEVKHVEEIMICNGATQGMQLVFSACFNPEDEIILAFPFYPQYLDLCTLHQVKVVELELNGLYQIEETRLDALINEKTKAILINTPHNPTGTFLNKESIQAIKRCTQNKDVLVIWDAVYDFMLDQAIKKEMRQCHNLVEVHSFSKAYAMCGLRLGYIIAEGKLIHYFEKIHQCSEVCSSSLIQKAMIGFSQISCQDIYTHYENNRQYAIARCNAMGLECVLEPGGFYVFPSIHKTHLSSVTFARILLNQFHVGVLPGKYFYQENHIRISCCGKFEDLVEGMNRLQAFMDLL